MKRILTLISILIIVYSLNAQELKGVYLGSYTKITTQNPKRITIVNENYSLITYNLKNGKVASIVAIPVDEIFTSVRNVSISEIKNVVNALQQKYDVTFDWIPETKEEKYKGLIKGSNDKYTVALILMDYNYVTEKYIIGISLRDNVLYEKYNQEKLNDL